MPTPKNAEIAKLVMFSETIVSITNIKYKEIPVAIPCVNMPSMTITINNRGFINKYFFKLTSKVFHINNSYIINTYEYLTCALSGKGAELPPFPLMVLGFMHSTSPVMPELFSYKPSNQ